MLMQPESLFTMALYDVDAVTQQDATTREVNTQSTQPAFYPVDEYKDLSLREILDISDDFLFGEDPLMNTPVYDTTPVPVTSSSHTVSPIPSNEIDENTKKRRRDSSHDYDTVESPGPRRFRPYQAGQWADKYEELCEYSNKMGHCLVPHTYKENLPLARWVKRQRYQYKLMMEGKPSTMTEERVSLLEVRYRFTLFHKGC